MIEDQVDDPKPPSDQDDDDILKEARARYRLCQDAEGDNRIDALDDLRFLVGGENQWDPRAVAARKADGRPIITVNTLPTYLHQVTNDQRQNSPSIKVHPVGDKADVDTAKIRQGLIRHIEYDSNADVCYDTAVNSAAAIGFGYCRVMPEYESEDSFNQKLMFIRVRNALSVKLDPLSTQADGSDAQYAFVECVVSRDEFKAKYPDAKASDTTVFQGHTEYVGWLAENTVLVCEYYRIEKETATVCLLSNGESGFKDKLLEMPPGVTIVKEREGTRSKVMWFKITATDILERTEIMCKWIPVFPVYGDEIDIEGKIIRSGIVRHAKGPAKSYNVMMSGATEEIAMRSKAPYIGAEGQFEGHEDQWTQANNRAFPYLEYNPKTVDGQLAPPPQRQPMADIPTGMLAMAMHASDNVKKTTGLFDASLGARGTATSGKQEIAQQREGDMANFHYMDGLLRTIRHIGRCINCMIPHYYDTERVVRVLREDDTAEYATINQPSTKRDEMGRAVDYVLNDMTCGEYDITVGAGPTYSTMRQESADAMGEAMNKNPQLWGVFGDLYVRSRDWPNADEIADRVAKTIPPAIRGPEDGKEPVPNVDTPQGPIPAPQASQMIGELMGQLQQAGEALKKVDAAKAAEAAAKAQEAAMKQQHLLNEQQLEPARQAAELEKLKAAVINAEAARVQAEADLLRAQSEAQIAPQRATAEMAKAHAESCNAENALRQPLDQPAPTADEIIALIEAKKPPLPSGMTIQAPSGAYDVALPKTAGREMPKSMTITAKNSGNKYEVTLH